MKRLWMIAMGLAIFTACEDQGPVYEYVQFNGDDDVIAVRVTAPGTPLGPATHASLLSTTGGAVVGTITVDPGSGPIGTAHRVTVDIRCDDTLDADCDPNDYQDRVSRVDLETTATERGSFAFELEQDSADAGIWVKSFTSYGDEGETRKDSFRVIMYELVEVAPDVAVNP